MAKKCKNRCSFNVYGDNINLCPMCGGELIIINSTGATTVDKKVTKIKDGKERTYGSKNTTIVKNKKNTIQSKNEFEGIVMNFRSNEVKRPWILKFIDSIIYGSSYQFNNTINTFQIYDLNDKSQQKKAIEVKINGDIVSGFIYDGNKVVVTGKKSLSGSVNAKKIYNETSNCYLTTTPGIPGRIFTIMGIMIVIFIISLVVEMVMNFDGIMASISNLISSIIQFAIVCIGLIIIIKGLITR